MGSDHRHICYVHYIPKAFIADVTYINDHAKPLRFLYILPAPVRQAAACFVRTGEAVLLVPAKCGNAESVAVKVLKSFGGKSKASRAFNGQNGRHDSLLQVIANIRCAAC